MDELGGGGVVAHDDEARRDLDAGAPPQLEGAGIVTVEGLQRGFELDGNAQGVERGGLPSALLRHLLADVAPQVAERRHLAARDVVRDRHPGQLHDAALDGVHEREVAHRPREERSFRVAGPAQEERRRGEIDHAPDAELAPHYLQARDPHPRGFLVLLRLGAVVALQGAFLVLLGWLLAVAVVGLVVEHQDVLHAHEVRHHPLEHLARGLAGRDVRAPTLEEGAASLREGEGLAAHEGVVVGDDDLRAVEIAEHVGRHQLAAAVVAVGVVRLEHPQAVADGEARGDHQESAREPPAAGTAHRVDGLPRDEHGHDRGLAGAGRELEREAREAGVRLRVGGGEMVEEAAAFVAEIRRDLGQPDRGLRGFDLTEEGPDIAEAVPLAARARLLQHSARCASSLCGCASASGAGPSRASPATGRGPESTATRRPGAAAR